MSIDRSGADNDQKGKAGRTSVNIGYYTGFSNPTRLRKFLNRPQYVELFSEAAVKAGLVPAEEFDGNGSTSILKMMSFCRSRHSAGEPSTS